MIDLFEMAIAKPLHCIVVCLCLVVGSTSAGLYKVREAVAVIQVEQREDTLTRAKVLEMNDVLIRVDTNVGILLTK